MNYPDSRLSRPGFIEGAGIALLISLLVTVSVASFEWFLPSGLMGYLLIIATGLGYLLYLLTRGRHKTGRVSVIAIYIASIAVMLIVDVSVTWFALLIAGEIWLVRSLYFHNSLLSALLDLGLTLFSLAGAVAAYLHTDSLFLSIWSLMLIQACFVWIPADWRQHARGKHYRQPTDRFDVALRAAENAVRKLAAHTSS
jgi:hypothetical protein